MLRTRIVGAVGALALLAAPAVAVAHGDGHHGGKHASSTTRSAPRDVAGRASATVQSFAAGELTLALANGRTLTADVSDRTKIVCHLRPAAPATTAAPSSARAGAAPRAGAARTSSSRGRRSPTPGCR